MVRLLALLVGLLAATPQSLLADTWRYVDDQGHVGFVDDPGKLPARYRARAQRIDEPGSDEQMSLTDRVRQIFEPVELPERRKQASTSSQGERGGSPAGQTVQRKDAAGAASGQAAGSTMGSSGSAVRGAGGARGGAGMAQPPAGGAAPQLNPEALKQLLDQFPTDRLTRKAVLSAVAMWASGLFWVIIGAIVLIGYILGTRSLIPLVDSPRMQMFWRWGFPVLSGIAIALLGAWRYRAWRELYSEMCRLAGL